MKNFFLFILLTISLILSSCKKDGEIKLPNTFCLKLSENDQFYEYDELNRIKDIYFYDWDGKKNIKKTFTYSGDTMIEVYGVPSQDWLRTVTVKSILGKNGFINTILTTTSELGQILNKRQDSFVYNDEGYLIKSIGADFKLYYFYKNGNLMEEWYTLNADSAILFKYEYDLLIENKEASLKEWVERKGKANKNLTTKYWDYSVSKNLYEYTYWLKNGFPIQTKVKYISETDTTNYFIYTTWSCLQ